VPGRSPRHTAAPVNRQPLPSLRAVQLLADVYWLMPEQSLHTGLDRFPAAPGGRLILSF